MRALFDFAWIVFVGFLMFALHFGALAIWPVYRIRYRARPRLRSLAVVFVVHVALVLAWTGLMVATGMRHRDHAWLAWLSTVYVALNGVFAYVYGVLWRRRSTPLAQAARRNAPRRLI